MPGVDSCQGEPKERKTPEPKLPTHLEAVRLAWLTSGSDVSVEWGLKAKPGGFALLCFAVQNNYKQAVIVLLTQASYFK